MSDVSTFVITTFFKRIFKNHYWETLSELLEITRVSNQL